MILQWHPSFKSQQFHPRKDCFSCKHAQRGSAGGALLTEVTQRCKPTATPYRGVFSWLMERGARQIVHWLLKLLSGINSLLFTFTVHLHTMERHCVWNTGIEQHVPPQAAGEVSYLVLKGQSGCDSEPRVLGGTEWWGLALLQLRLPLWGLIAVSINFI